MIRRITTTLIAAALLTFAAETGETYKARLSPVPADARTRADLTGTGSASATLAGSKLTVTGAFEGLKTAVTTVSLRAGVAGGVRGPAVAELTAPKAVSGVISGSLDLTPEQLTALHKSGFYIEIHTEKAPDGALWGWLIRQESSK